MQLDLSVKFFLFPCELNTFWLTTKILESTILQGKSLIKETAVNHRQCIKMMKKIFPNSRIVMFCLLQVLSISRKCDSALARLLQHAIGKVPNPKEIRALGYHTEWHSWSRISISREEGAAQTNMTFSSISF